MWSRRFLLSGSLFMALAFFLPTFSGCVELRPVDVVLRPQRLDLPPAKWSTVPAQPAQTESSQPVQPDPPRPEGHFLQSTIKASAFVFPYLHGLLLFVATLYLVQLARRDRLRKAMDVALSVAAVGGAVSVSAWWVRPVLPALRSMPDSVERHFVPFAFLLWTCVAVCLLLSRDAKDPPRKIAWMALAGAGPAAAWLVKLNILGDGSVGRGWLFGVIGTATMAAGACAALLPIRRGSQRQGTAMAVPEGAVGTAEVGGGAAASTARAGPRRKRLFVGGALLAMALFLPVMDGCTPDMIIRTGDPPLQSEKFSEEDWTPLFRTPHQLARNLSVFLGFLLPFVHGLLVGLFAWLVWETKRKTIQRSSGWVIAGNAIFCMLTLNVWCFSPGTKYSEFTIPVPVLLVLDVCFLLSFFRGLFCREPRDSVSLLAASGALAALGWLGCLAAASIRSGQILEFFVAMNVGWFVGVLGALLLLSCVPRGNSIREA